MVKTRGKKKNKLVFILILLFLCALILLTKPWLIIEKKPPPTPDESLSIPTKPLPLEVPSKPEKPMIRARMAIIIDDVGYHSENIEEYIHFNGKLTFAVIPFLNKSENYAEILHRSGFEVIIHIPMEPLDYPSQNPGLGALFSDDRKRMVEYKLDRMIRRSPYARGANNHMGSKVTQDQELMKWTLTHLKRHNLYFIDSVTTQNSCAYEVAQAINMPTAKRDVFLDNYTDFPSINSQFETLKTTAKMNGTAIGIGHIQNENLLRVLNHQLPLLEQEGIELIYASEALTTTEMVIN